MNSVVIYGSRHGNALKVAEAIAAELGKHGAVDLVSADKACTHVSRTTDFVVIGGPTEAHRMTEQVARFFDQVDKGALVGKAAAAFDTRLPAPAWLSGSAGSGIDRKLRKAGALLIAPHVSFFVSGKLPDLELGELARATAWAASLAAKMESKAPVAAGL